MNTLHRFTFVLALLALPLAACQGTSEEAAPGAPEAIPAHAVAPDRPLPDGSIYLATATWTDQQGQETQLADLRGRPVVLSMIYTRCGYACPTIVRDMQRIDERLSEALRSEVRYVLVSMDPTHDTPEELAHFARTHRLDDRWTLLTGHDADVRFLAALLGVRYQQEASGGISHTNLIAVLDAEGRTAHQQKGLQADPTASADALQTLLAKGF